MREYFCAYNDMLGAMRKLSDAECGRLFRALLSYSAGDMPNNLQGREELLFDVFSQQIDRDANRYHEKCEKNKANGSVRKRSVANGSEPSQEKDKEKEKDVVVRTRATAPTEPWINVDKCGQAPLLTETEMDSASAAYQSERQAILAAMERVGMQPTAFNADTALALAATHGAQAVMAALDRAATHDRKGGVSWAFVRSILEKPRQPKPKMRKVRETVYIGGEAVETVREVPYDQPVW